MLLSFSSIGIDDLKSELTSFMEEIIKVTNLFQKEAPIKDEEYKEITYNTKDGKGKKLKDPFKFTFLLFDKRKYWDKFGYQWLFLPHHLVYIKYMVNSSKLTDDEFNKLLYFVYLGKFLDRNLSDPEEAEKILKECSGAAWRVVHKGENEIIVYNLSEGFGEYKLIDPTTKIQVYCDPKTDEKIKEIEVKLWTHPNKGDEEFWIIQKEIFRKEYKDDDELFSLQILGRLLTEELAENFVILTKLFKRFQYSLESVFDSIVSKRRILKEQKKTGIISILVDSYAHNISAHSLAALKWWFQKREKIYDKRIELKRKDETTANDKPFINKLSQFSLKEIDTNILNDIAEKTNKYYKKLGLGDSNNNENFTSLMEIAQFSSYSGLLGHNYFYKAFDGNSQEIQNLNFHIPVPVDYALWPFMKFLRDKAGFWSGVTRDLPFGGESINLYDVLFKDFASNPLFLGTIAHSEGIHKLNIKLQIEGLLDDKILDFAQIDLSVIGYEENLLKSRDITINSDDKSEYSKYKFLRLGKDFEQIREEIKQEKYNMFFPGGIVGEHAFFTILENTLRNIKHYKNSVDWEDIIKDGIDFVISIKPAWLLGDSKENKRPELFNIEVWLDHKNIIYEKKNENGKEKIYDAYKTLVDNTKLPIVNDEGKPRLGGNAQDKICAAMLLNNTFKSVEDSVQSKIGKYYYNEKKESYWIGFNTKDITEEKKNNEIVKKIGKISKNFHLWKSEFIFVLKNLKDLQSENISRFKFVYIDSDDKGREELEIAAKDMGVIRILKKDDFEKYSINREFIEEDIRNILSNNLSRDTYYSIYLIWFKKFFQNLSFNIKKASDTPDPNPIHHIDNYSIDPINSKDDKNTIELIFAHGDKKGNTPWEVLDYRTHGKLRDTYFLDDNFNSYNNKKINEFIEILLTKICLFDDRIYERIPEEKIDYKIIEENSFNLYSEKLNLMFKPESRKEWDGINIQNDKKGILKENYNFLVVHLSFIENELGFSEKNINEFIEKELDIKKADTIEKFILVITTGRGRFEWHENLDPNYKKFTIFRPIESLLSSVEDAVAFKDDFQLKYNLVKVILGS